MIGNFGDAEVFSFHATKFFNSLEGGAIVTNNGELAEKARLMRNFGFAGYDEVIYLGTNGKMNEISAAMGLTSLESLEEFIVINRRNYCEYKRGLAGIPGLELLTYNEKEKCNYQYIVAFIEEATTRIGRDQILQVLWAENVLARRYFYPGCHRMEPYRTLFPKTSATLPVTEQVVERVLTLPTGTAMTGENIQKVCQIIRFAVSRGQEIRELLERKGLVGPWVTLHS
jgi:dTDP-4-amino-4,6-dideoxygalactose transaminase